MHGQQNIKPLCQSHVEIVNYLSNGSLHSKTNTKPFSSFRGTIAWPAGETNRPAPRIHTVIPVLSFCHGPILITIVLNLESSCHSYRIQTA